MIDIKPTKGKLLISEPSILNDNDFNRSVILLTEHDQNGTVGFILNKLSNYTVQDLVPEIESNHKVYLGGPVAEDNLYFVHRVPNMIPNSIEIETNDSGGIYWGGDFEAVQDLLSSNSLSPNDIRFFLGYSGWSKNQLDNEIKITSWIIKDNNYQNIFETNPETLWKDELLKLDSTYQIWANAPKNPNLN
jgi:putative transcriptional regulator